jgi:hypothetical protein
LGELVFVKGDQSANRNVLPAYGTIKKINTDGTYDVKYAEFGGRKHVAKQEMVPQTEIDVAESNAPTSSSSSELESPMELPDLSDTPVLPTPQQPHPITELRHEQSVTPMTHEERVDGFRIRGQKIKRLETQLTTEKKKRKEPDSVQIRRLKRENRSLRNQLKHAYKNAARKLRKQQEQRWSVQLVRIFRHAFNFV